jgi:hypothetical protein
LCEPGLSVALKSKEKMKMPSIRSSLMTGAAVLLAAGPAAAQQAAPAARDGQRVASSTGVARSAFMTNVTSEFAQIDANKDGKATPAEIQQHRVMAMTQRRQANNRAAFTRLDADKNGSLSPQEFAALVASPPQVNVAPLVTKLDANKDGAVTQAEFQAGAAADFNRLDTNKDNVLSPAEVRAGNQRR